MAAQTAPDRTYGHLLSFICIFSNVHAFLLVLADNRGGDVCSTSLHSTLSTYNLHCPKLWFVVAAPLHQSNTPLQLCYIR